MHRCVSDDSAQCITILPAEIQHQTLLCPAPGIVRQFDAITGDEITVIIPVFIESRMHGHHAAHVDVPIIIFHWLWRMAIIAQFFRAAVYRQWEQFDLPDHRDFPVVIGQERNAFA